MCGFIGKISSFSHDIENLDKANETILCRGPDSTKNISTNVDGYDISLIFNRLSIIDLNENADQPMTSGDQNYILMFNGEIYNHQELRKSLEKQIKFRTSHSDSEVVLNGLITHGISFVKELRGQFSIFFLNKKENTCYLIKDRLGQKPLYYNLENNSISFGSNLKSLIKLNKNYVLDDESINEYFRYGAVAKDKTIFKNYYKVLPAEIIEIKWSGGVQGFDISSENYWELESFVDENNFSSETFFEILTESIEIRTNADVPVANFLSGGIDSTSIIKNLYDNNKNVNSFSVRFKDPKYDESNWSRMVAEKYKTNHKEVFLSSEINEDVIHDSLSSLDEPYYDPSVVPSYILSKEISNHYKVAISGDGGDELLGGYKRTMDSLKSKSFINNIFSKFYNFYPPALGTGNKFLSQSSDINTRYRSYLEDMNLLKLLEITPSQRSEYVINIKAQYEDYKGLLLSDYRFYLPDMMMFKIDRTSMANSLEIRSPFVDHKLVEYIMSTKSSYINLNNSKNILKNYLSQDFSNDFLNRDKQGFVFDIENWIFQNLSMLNETLNTGKVSNYIPANFALKVAKYKSRINSHRIWKLFVLNHYLENLD